MAERRMFAKSVIDSDLFLEMPLTAQLLYFHLALRADDDGFINRPKAIMKMCGCKDDDMKVLFAKQFVIPFESGVCVIRHWKIHNYIRQDRYKETVCTAEKNLLRTDENNVYSTIDNQMETNGIPNDNQMDTQVRLGKVSIGKDRYICSKSVSSGTDFDEQFAQFWNAYPKKVSKKAAQKAFTKIKPNDELLAKMLNAIENQKRSEQWKKDNGQFIPYPSTWLNGEQWNDEPTEAIDKNARFTNSKYYDNAEW